MRIERIEKSKHKQERVLVFLEGGLLRITGVELLRFGLHKDMELPEELVEELRRSAERSETSARRAPCEQPDALEKGAVRPAGEKRAPSAAKLRSLPTGSRISARWTTRPTRASSPGTTAPWATAPPACARSSAAAASAATSGRTRSRSFPGRGGHRAVPARQVQKRRARPRRLQAPVRCSAAPRLSWQDIRPALSRLGEELPED